MFFKVNFDNILMNFYRAVTEKKYPDISDTNWKVLNYINNGITNENVEIELYFNECYNYKTGRIIFGEDRTVYHLAPIKDFEPFINFLWDTLKPPTPLSDTNINEGKENNMNMKMPAMNLEFGPLRMSLFHPMGLPSLTVINGLPTTPQIRRLLM